MIKARNFILTLFLAITFCTLSMGQSTDENYIEATFESATVYTGKTDYAFKNAQGRLIQFSFSNLGENEPWNPTLPDNLLESNVDGVPGANPELVGKTFLLIYGEGGDMISEVRLKE